MGDTVTIKKWIIPISGFTQDRGRANGFDKLWTRLKTLGSADTEVVIPQRWRSNFDSLADFIDRHSDENARVIVIAYSWGCGHGFRQFAGHLAKRGIGISHAVLCDPVYHDWLRLWRSLIFSPPIMIPVNVARVTWFRQYKNKPAGTELKAIDVTCTHISEPVVLQRTHEYMDDAPQFHEHAFRMAE